MLKAGTKMAQYYTVFNYGPPIQTIVAGTGTNLSPRLVLPGNSKEKFGTEITPDVLLMDKLETSLATTDDKSCGNIGGAIVERFIKTRASKSFGHPVYYLYGPGPSISIPSPHGEIFNSGFGIWMGGKKFKDGFCRPTRIHKVWMALGIRQHTV